MRKRSELSEEAAALRRKIIGLGEYSFRKSYYPELQRRLAAVEEAERQATEALALTDTLFASAPVGLAFVDRDLRVVRANKALAGIDAVSVEEYLGRRPGDVVPDLKTQVEPALLHVLETGEAIVEVEIRREAARATGGSQYLLASYYPVRTPAGEIIGVGAVVADITERRQREEALRQSEELFRTLSAFAPVGIFRMDEKGRCTYVNIRWEEITGRPAGEGLGMGWVDTIHPEDREATLRGWAEGIRAPSKASREIRLVTPQGETRWVSIRTAPHFSSDGRVVGYVGTMEDITDRVRAEEERAELLEREQAARAEAQAANAAKDQFLAVLSHELRNPLSPILTGISVLQRTTPQESPAQGTLAIIERNARLQARLVNDLLDLSRIARGKIDLRHELMRLESAVRSAVDAVRDDAQHAGLSLETDIGTGLWVLGDFDRLQQVVLNLLNNAVKFTPPGGIVRVLARQTDGMARIVVEDTGIGMDAELRKNLFEMFFQGETGTRQRQGLGIGLALVKRLSELHGGQVQAESEGPGKGSRFTVEIPLAHPPQAAGTSDSGGGREAGGTLLLVEDNPDTRAILVDALTLSGYQVHAVPSGEEALEALQQIQPDAILADIGLPGMSGYEFLQRAREMPGLADVPAFALTGYGQEEDVRRARDAGFTEHFVKPVEVDALEKRISEQLRSRSVTTTR